MSHDDVVIRADGLGKRFKVYPSPFQRLAEWLSFGTSKRHSDFWALKDISFEVKRGECLGIIGQNGSGKSTLLKILSGAMTHTEGQHHVHGRTLSLLELGMGFNREITGRQNVRNSASLLGFPKDYLTDERMEMIEEFADIGEFFDRSVRMYSSGMFVRLAFAMFIFMEPDVFIIDEALSVGDVFFQQKCFEKIRELIGKGVTILFVSHDMQAVQSLSQRVALLSHGQIVNMGPPEEIVSKYFGLLTKGSQGKPSVSRWNIPAGVREKTIDTKNMVMDPEEIIAHSVLNGKNRQLNDGAKLLAARVIDENGDDSLSFPLMSNARFYLLIEAERMVKHPNAGVAIYDRMNNLVFSSSTAHLGVAFPDLARGDRICVAFQVTLNIQPGQYTFSLAAGEPADISNPNVGRICDRHNLLGPLSVTFDYSTMAPFNGIAMLPMEVIE